MNPRSLQVLATLFSLALTLGCAGGNPAAPSPDQNAPDEALGSGKEASGESHAMLWGYYDVYVDVESQTATAVLNRQAMNTWNIVALLNQMHAKLHVNILSTPIGVDFIDVDADVTITHPMAGMPQFNAYDVRCVFMGNGSGFLEYNEDLRYAVLGEDQYMRDFDESGDWEECGNPDGYTRWFNRAEFIIPGLLGYTTPAGFGKKFDGDSTLNPYKYYADGLGPCDDLWEFLMDDPSSCGVFSAGSMNTRSFYVRFPMKTGIRFGCAILANWLAPEIHPDNAPEAVACSVDVVPDLYYKDETDNGGDLMLDVSLFGWNFQPSAIWIESTVLSAPHRLTAEEMEPIGGCFYASTYHVDIPADNIHGTEGNEFWVIAEYEEYDYRNEFGIPNCAGYDDLAAAFRYDLYVSPIGYNCSPYSVLEVQEEFPFWDPEPVEVHFDGSDSWDPDGYIISYEWDFDGDWEFDEDPDDAYTGDPQTPTRVYSEDWSGQACLRVTDDLGADDVCCVDVEVDIGPASKNIPLREDADAYDLAVDHEDGDLLVLYDDGQVWTHAAIDRYQTSSYLFDVTPGADRIDVSGLSDIVVGGNQSGSLEWIGCYDSSGSLLAEHVAYDGATDVIAFRRMTWVERNYLGMFCGSSDPAFDFALLRYPAQDYDEATGALWVNEYGWERLHRDIVLGCESAKSCWSVYFLEGDPDWHVERFTWAFEFENICWGGTHTDAYFGFNDPRDITRDDKGNVYVLDLLSTGEPAVKAHGEEDDYLGVFGDSESISGEPLRIEGSDYSGKIFVLHADGLSIFFPHEMQ